MAFGNNPPVTQIIIPSDGSPTPGSGATVIGGPLPVELINLNYTGSGIIWYAAPGDEGFYRYNFIVHQDVQPDSLNSGGILLGTCNVDGSISVTQRIVEDSIFFKNRLLSMIGQAFRIFTVSTYANPTVQLSAGTAANETTAYILDGGYWHGTTSASPSRTSYMTADDTDQWVTKTTVVAGSILGATSWTFVVDYLISFDRHVDVRYSITPNTPTTAAGTASFVSGGFQAAFPLGMSPTASPSGLAIKGSYNANTGVGVSQGIRGGAGMALTLFNLPTATSAIVGSFSYLTAKPNF